MSEYIESHSYRFVFDLLLARLEERAPAKIQLLAGPRQVGKTTLLGEIAVRWEGRAIYASADAPEAELPGWADGIWRRAVEKSSIGPAVLLLDEVHFLPEWSRWLKARHDEVVRKKIPLHTVATGSSALDLGDGSRETMAGRFEKLSLHHWGAGALVDLLGVKRAEAPLRVVTCGGYPGARPFWKDEARLRSAGDRTRYPAARASAQARPAPAGLCARDGASRRSSVAGENGRFPCREGGVGYHRPLSQSPEGGLSGGPGAEVDGR
ncbi:MAG: hypothetical protein EBS90_09805 [Betaproteobacteria bacterium]|nr:hypothetical protein [Betaproteobacteria bacterium]